MEEKNTELAATVQPQQTIQPVIRQKKRETSKKKTQVIKPGEEGQAKSADAKKKRHSVLEKKRTLKKQKSVIHDMQAQVNLPVPPPDQPMTEVKLGFMQKLKLFFTNAQMTLKSCFDRIMLQIYHKSDKGDYKRKQFSMKFFPLEDIIMCLDEYLYKFERMDNREDFNKKLDEDEESEDEDDQENMDRQKDRNKYFQFWQWNYMFTDNNEDRGRKKDNLLTRNNTQLNDSEDDEISSDEEEEEESDEEIKNQLKMQSQFSIKLKEVKKECSMLKKEVKANSRQFKINNREMEKINLGTAKLTEQYDKLKDDYLEICQRNKMLLKRQQEVFEVKDSIKHIHLKQY